MKKFTPIVVILLALLLSGLLGLQFINLAAANFFPLQTPQPAIIIRRDRSVDPPTAPIQQNGNVLSLTADIFGYTISVECDNIILDGGGHVLIGNGSSTGILLQEVSNVIVKNMGISNFSIGIRLYTIPHAASRHNTIVGSTITNNDHGIMITLDSGQNNITGNNIKNNKCGIKFYSCYGQNVIYHNNFINNTNHVIADSLIATWDNGEEGNNWDDYNSTDTDGDGIGETPYIIDKSNQDNYPLIEPLEIPEQKIPDIIPEFSSSDTIPEFSSWIVLPLFLVVTLIVVGIKRKLFRPT